ncbi:hypothetical protein [Bacillus sp. 2205SS5-2]|uniref:hypothetical protein n=1 Tax=Bacillus sp. 2205SS5-2 TaxID=3109031 RepID=UPI003005E239
MKKFGKLEAILWSIAFPGFPQLLLHQYVKGILFVLLEIIINMKSHFNSAIMLSFLGKTREAAEVVNYQWLLFYPCLYFFSMWDAYRNTLDNDEYHHYIPFAISAYFVTIGLMVSPQITIFEIFFGPIFLPIIFVIPGLFIGLFIRKLLLRKQFQNKEK